MVASLLTHDRTTQTPNGQGGRTLEAVRCFLQG